MKVFQKLFMLAMIAGAMMLVGWANKGAATISVKVMKAGKAQVGEQVYMYRGSLQDAFLMHKVHATRNVATDENGVAEFAITLSDFGAGGDQATFIFETFDAAENVNGKVAVSVRKGDSKTATINQ